MSISKPINRSPNSGLYGSLVTGLRLNSTLQAIAMKEAVKECNSKQHSKASASKSTGSVPIETVKEMRARYQYFMWTYKDLADHYGLNVAHVKDIINGIIYAKVFHKESDAHL